MPRSFFAAYVGALRLTATGDASEVPSKALPSLHSIPARTGRLIDSVEIDVGVDARFAGGVGGWQAPR